MEVEIKVTVQYSKRKTLTMRLISLQELLVKAPLRCPQNTIDNFIKSHQEWLKKRIAEMKISVANPPFTAEEKKTFSKQTKEILIQKLPFFAQKLGVFYRKVAVKSMKTRWGSCSSEQNLNFNCLLSQAPEFVQDGIICHELCHLKQMNHQKRFYALLYQLFPNYAECDKWLKSEGKLMMRRMR